MEADVSDNTANGTAATRRQAWAATALAGAAGGALLWSVSGAVAIACAMAVLAAGAAWFAFRPGQPAAHPFVPPADEKALARQLAATARAHLDRIGEQARHARDDEIALRAQRLRNTATLMIEALMEAPARHHDLQPYLTDTLETAAHRIEVHVTGGAASSAPGTRSTFLRYLQDTELQLEYAVRSAMTRPG